MTQTRKMLERRTLCWLTLGMFVGCLSLAGQARAEPIKVELKTVDGTQLEGALVEWDNEAITLQTKNEQVEIASKDILRAKVLNTQQSPEEPQTLVGLVGGTRLPFRSYEATDARVIIATPLSETPLSLTRNDIHFVQYNSELAWKEIVAQEATGDLLVVRKKKTGKFSFLSGLLGDISSETVDFEWDGEELSVKRSKIAAVAYYHANQTEHKKNVCWLNLRGGGRLPVDKVSLRVSPNEQSIVVRTSRGLQLVVPMQMIRNADYAQGKLAYLSDLEPLAVDWTPRISLPTSAELVSKYGLPRRDQSFAGSMLSLLWPSSKSSTSRGELKTYSKGLALRSRTEIRYRVPEGMQRFVTTAGIDPETASEGSVTLKVFAGRKQVWQGEIVGGVEPVPIQAAIGGARELRILVDFGANLDYGDRLHLVEARFSQ